MDDYKKYYYAAVPSAKIIPFGKYVCVLCAVVLWCWCFMVHLFYGTGVLCCSCFMVLVCFTICSRGTKSCIEIDMKSNPLRL